ncbi:type IV pilus modification PilV family protein [Desulfosediminicola flagellatus]|uniref:type IV pilus modification PilV family protein n=1 Tax=Desulfosediminicola flagellatus TaxID=2569541 RepID=UPI00142F18F6|nr:prepilin-type N-terminal cleavage/methylation domain-containing protein [Desulfosediminicola flagellatus]
MTREIHLYKTRECQGFTLIETVVAMVILTIGILALYSMQTTSVRFNATASALTTSASWASDRIERLLALDFDDQQLKDDNDATDLAPAINGNGAAGLDDTSATVDGRDLSPDGKYVIYWNVADYITPNPNLLSESTLKAIRVIVQRSDSGRTREVVLNYYKQKVF